MIDLRPVKIVDRRFNKFYVPAIRMDGLPARIRISRRFFKRATEATAYARRMIERYERLTGTKQP